MTGTNGALQQFRNSLAQLGDDLPSPDILDEERVCRAENVFNSKLDGHMAVDLETCIHCGMCAEACHFYEATGDERYTPIFKLEPLRRHYRRELSPMRWLFRPFTRALTADQLREWQPLVYDACTGCGRCDMMCPMGISLSPMIDVMREGLASAGLEPDELRAMSTEQRDHGTVLGVDAAALRKRISRLEADGIHIPLDREQADIVVLTTAVEVLVFGDTLKAVARIMNKLDVSWTMLGNAFEATNIGLVSGDEAAQRQATEAVVARATACGATTLVVPETGHAYQALRWEGANELGKALPFEVLALSEFIAREAGSGRLQLKAASGKAPVTYHDPCRLGRQSGVYDEPRNVLKAMGLEIRETESNKRENYCCGGGCGEYVIKRAAPLRQKAFEIKQREFDKTGAEQVITSCANCRVNLAIGAENAHWPTPVKGLAELVADNLAD